jgi:hypothetical protein
VLKCTRRLGQSSNGDSRKVKTGLGVHAGPMAAAVAAAPLAFIHQARNRQHNVPGSQHVDDTGNR